MLKNNITKFDHSTHAWHTLSALILCLYASFMIIQWQNLPLFLDMFYHLKVAQEFAQAGKICTYNFWEYAPSGMPHIYPPLLHVIMAIFLKIGIDGIMLTKLISIVSPIVLLSSIYYVIKKTICAKIAFFILLSITYSRLFITTLSFTAPATIAMALLLYALLLIYQRNILLSVVILGIIHYMHTGVGISSLIFIVLLRLFRVISIKDSIILITTPILIASPWLYHVFKGLREITFKNSANMPITIYIFPYAFAAVGIFAKIDRKIKATLLAFSIALIFYSIFYPFRAFTSQFATGIYMFSGIGLTALFDKLNRLLEKFSTIKKYKLLISGSIIFVSILTSFSIIFYNKSIKINNNDSIISTIPFIIYNKPNDVISSNIYDKKDIRSLSKYVYENTKKGEIIWSNYRYLAGLLSIETGRPTATSMLLEVRPNKKHGLTNVSLVFIIKDNNWHKNIFKNTIEKGFSIVGTEMIDQEILYVMLNKKGKT